MKFTDTYLRNLKTPPKKTYVRESDGFTLRILPSGAKTFLLIYIFDGKRKEFNLGTYPHTTLADARSKCADAKKLLAKNHDPSAMAREARDQRRLTPSVADFVHEYISRYAKEHNRAWKEIERVLKAEIVPRWGKRKITDIRRRDLVVVLDEIKDRMNSSSKCTS